MMADSCIVHFSAPLEDSGELLVERLVKWAEENGWRRCVKEGVELEIDRSIPGLTARESLLWNGAEGAQTVDVYAYDLPARTVRIVGVEIHSQYFSGFFSRDLEKRDKSRRFVGSLLRFLEHLIQDIRPASGWGDVAANFPTTDIENPVVLEADQLLRFATRRINRPWLIYFGPMVIQRFGEQRIHGIRAADKRTVAAGILIVFRESPF